MAKKPQSGKSEAAKAPVKKQAKKAAGSAAKTGAKARSKSDEPSAEFVFSGTVIRIGASCVAEVTPAQDLAVVQIQSILHGPEILLDYQGSEVTVKLGAKQKVAEGGTYIFHTNGWVFGSGLALVCVAVEDAKDKRLAGLQMALAAAPAAAVKARADRAELVLSGKVTQVREAPRLPDQPISEHDPHWQEAVVKVHEVHRGATGKKAGAANDVVIRFAASHDVRWARAPKFAVGHEGVWMLGDRSSEGPKLRAAAAVPADQYLVLEPGDFHPKEQAASVLAQIAG